MPSPARCRWERVRNGGPQEASTGGVAQLGERLNGIQEVSGSIPLVSTPDGARVNMGAVVGLRE